MPLFRRFCPRNKACISACYIIAVYTAPAYFRIKQPDIRFPDLHLFQIDCTQLFFFLSYINNDSPDCRQTSHETNLIIKAWHLEISAGPAPPPQSDCPQRRRRRLLFFYCYLFLRLPFYFLNISSTEHLFLKLGLGSRI